MKMNIEYKGRKRQGKERGGSEWFQNRLRLSD